MAENMHMALGFADAVVVATAARLRTSLVATADRRHFSRLIPLHAAAFTLLPGKL